ncbi:MAG: hypothetical protein AB8B32_07965, partial [Prochlorococcus sp.]
SQAMKMAALDASQIRSMVGRWARNAVQASLREASSRAIEETGTRNLFWQQLYFNSSNRQRQFII